MAHDVRRPIVLLCDENGDRRAVVTRVLAGSGCDVRESARLASLDTLADGIHPSLIVLAVSSTIQRDAFGAIERLKSADRRLPILLIVSDGSEALAVAALRLGVKDYLHDPVDAPALELSVKRLLSNERRSRDGSGGADSKPRTEMVGASMSIKQVTDYLDKLANRDVTVLITGETGTGKELAAARIHRQSRRRHGGFVSVNCAAIPENLLESELFGHESGAFTGASGTRPGLLQVADRGTVFLDEIGDMGLGAQAKVLRAIESREVYRVGGKKPIPIDVRVVAATNHDIERAAEEGRFRQDLYYRLNVARVHLPPLRERRGDIVTLLHHYLDQFNRADNACVRGFSDEALQTLRAYDWPGNVRELKNLVEAIFVSPPDRPIRIEDLPDAFRQRLARINRMPVDERKQLVNALFAANWNKSQAAAMLRWSRMTVYRKMAKYAVVHTSEVAPAKANRRSGNR